jgi:hypothetical protein
MGLRAEVNKDCTTDILTFGVLALRYIDAEFPNEGVVHYVKKVMIPKWGNVPADDIRRKDVRDWLKALDYSGPTIGKIKGIMHAIYQYGLFEEICSSNPCSGWRLKGIKSTYKAITVTPEETLIDPAVSNQHAVFHNGVHGGSNGSSRKRSDRSAMGGHYVERESYPSQQALAAWQGRQAEDGCVRFHRRPRLDTGSIPSYLEGRKPVYR